jgi:DNA-directed RNA polymerase specialized sigma24 family protein
MKSFLSETQASFNLFSFCLSFSEIGKALNMPEATAKTYFQRARPLLRTAMAVHWKEERAGALS